MRPGKKDKSEKSDSGSLKSDKSRNSFFSVTKSNSELTLPQSSKPAKEVKHQKSFLEHFGKKIFSSDKKDKVVDSSTEDISKIGEEKKKSKMSKMLSGKTKSKSSSMPDVSLDKTTGLVFSKC